MNNTWRRRVVGGALMALAATACSGGDDSGRPGQTAPAGCGLDELAAHDGPVEITVWHFLAEIGDGAPSVVFSDLVDRFNGSQQKVRVKVKAIGSRPELVRRYMAIRPGGRGAPDLVQLPSPPSRAAADTRRVVPVQPCLDASQTDLADFVPSALAGTRAEGVQWGLPDGHAADLLLYDAGAFVRAGLDPDRAPRTLAELRAAAERLHAAGVSRPIARLDVFSLLQASGVQLADANDGHDGPQRRTTFGSPDAHEVLRWAQRLVSDQLVAPFNPNGAWAEDLLAIGRGEAAMTFHTSLDLKDVSKALAQGQAPGFRMGVAPLPTLHGPARSQHTAGSFLLSNGPSLVRRAAAWKFLEWFESPAQQVEWHRDGTFFPTRLSAAADPGLAALWSREPLGEAWAAMTGPDWVAVPFVGAQARLGRELAGAIEQVVLHGMAPEGVLSQAAANSDKHLADYAAEAENYVRWLIEG